MPWSHGAAESQVFVQDDDIPQGFKILESGNLSEGASSTGEIGMAVAVDDFSFPRMMGTLNFFWLQSIE